METDKKALFEKLLQQIKWPQDDRGCFENAEIQEVDVHAKSKQWDFHLLLDDILPYQDFLKFDQQVAHSFEHIAVTDLFIKAREPKMTGKALGEYWPWVVAHTDVNSPLINELAHSQVPYLDDGRVMLLVENDVIKNFLKNSALGPIEDAYQKLGFPEFNIKILVDQSKSQEKIAEMRSEKKKNDQELAQKAMAAIRKQGQQRKEKAKKKVLPKVDGPVQIGSKIKDGDPVTQMINIQEEERSVVIQGYIFDKEIRKLRSGRQLLIIKVTDYSSSMVVKKFSRDENEEAMFAAVKAGQWVKVRGSVQEDSFMRDLTINAYAIKQIKHAERQDKSEEGKRAELHLHSNMSMMDATNSISDYINQAAKWGHKAIAITDHATLQAFPEAHNAAKGKDIKVLYGVEINLVDDGVPIAYNEKHVNLRDATYVVFDTETTGLSARYDKVIELAAVKMKNGTVIDRFEQFIDPGHPLSETTINLTSITDDMVRGSKSEKEVFQMFKDFCKDTIIVGHNATFDVDFMNTGYARHDLGPITEPWIDTLPLARLLYPEMKGFRLNTLAKKLKVDLEHHHRAIYDAEATGYIYFAMLKDAEKQFNIAYQDQFNDHVGQNEAYKHEHPSHAIVMAQTQAGLKNMFKMVSESMVDYFYRVPRVPRSVLNKYRKGLLVGSACSNGEVFTAMMQKGYDVARRKAEYYDYLEVQPKPLYQPLLDQGLIQDDKQLE